ncbi:MAG TPA: type II secretion system protein [Terriglobales bacterium]|nr:type II secretion system protein [Terriglobales bacterium]
MARAKGFSLVELLIVVTVILLLAAIAIPNLLRSRVAANEASAVGSLRAINDAEITYNLAYPNPGFACALSQLGPPSGGGAASSAGAGLIDAALASGSKSGYNFAPGSCPVATNSNIVTGYQWGADPITPGSTGQRHFCTDSTVVIKSDPTSSSTCLVSGSPI